MIVGGQDGSITILVVAQLEEEDITDEETIADTANYLRNLPSRRIHQERGAKTKTRRKSKEIQRPIATDTKEGADDDTDSTGTLNTFEERMRDERRAEVRRRFR